MRAIAWLLLAALAAAPLAGCVMKRHRLFLRQEEKYVERNNERLLALYAAVKALTEEQRAKLVASIDGSSMDAERKATARKLVQAVDLAPDAFAEFVDTAEEHSAFVRREAERIKEE